MTDRTLIVNADDFGLSPGVNRGILHAHQHGIVTSTSLMVRGPAAQDGVRAARQHPALAIGIHVDLGEWHYTDGEWKERYRVVAMDDAAQVATEVAAQLEAFRRMTGREPTHLDSHQHVHHDRNVKPALLEIGDRLGVPVRAMTPGIRHEGAFYGQDGRGVPYPDAISVQALVAVITALPSGTTELACHPGFDSDLETTYREERAIEVAALCHHDVRAAIEGEGIALRSFASFRP